MTQIHWLPITEEEVSDEEALEQQRKFEEEVKKEEEELEHKFLVALEYCDWLPEDTKQQRCLKKSVKECEPYCCFNHQLGLPRKKYEDKSSGEVRESDPLPLYKYERDTIEYYESHRYYSQNKVRGSGITEVLAIRHMMFKYGVMNHIKNRKYLLAAGQSRSVAVGIFKRAVDWLKPYVRIIFEEMPNYSNPKFLKFRSGGEAHALPSEPNAPRGLDNVGDVILDEAAFWDLEDDEPVLKAFEPFIVKSGAKIGVFSTPNGQRGFFWTKIFNPETITKYFMHVVTFEQVTYDVKEPIIDLEEAEELRKTDPDLFAQEFGNQFILPSTSVFGSTFDKQAYKAEF